MINLYRHCKNKGFSRIAWASPWHKEDHRAMCSIYQIDEDTGAVVWAVQIEAHLGGDISVTLMDALALTTLVEEITSDVLKEGRHYVDTGELPSEEMLEDV